MSDEQARRLLEKLADALGMVPAAFLSDGSAAAQDRHEVLLPRLTRAFLALPDDGQRLRVLRIVERLAARATRGEGEDGTRG